MWPRKLIDPETILITGATSGIGKALALAYSAPGKTLFLCGRRITLLEAVAEECRKKGAEAFIRRCDVTDRDSVRQWLIDCDERKTVDLLIVNAGVGGLDSLAGAFGEDEKAVHRIFAVNVQGVINSIEPLKPRMVARSRGQIAIVSSLASYFGLPDSPAYCATKAAARVYGEALRPVLAPHGVQVNVICPGFVRSEMSDQLPFTLPLLMQTDKAANFIKRKLRRNKARISFPFPLAFASWLGMILPASVSGFIMGKFRKYPSA